MLEIFGDLNDIVRSARKPVYRVKAVEKSQMSKLDKAQMYFYLSGGSLFTVMFTAWVMWFLGMNIGPAQT